MAKSNSIMTLANISDIIIIFLRYSIGILGVISTQTCQVMTGYVNKIMPFQTQEQGALMCSRMTKQRHPSCQTKWSQNRLMFSSAGVWRLLLWLCHSHLLSSSAHNLVKFYCPVLCQYAKSIRLFSEIEFSHGLDNTSYRPCKPLPTFLSEVVVFKIK